MHDNHPKIIIDKPGFGVMLFDREVIAFSDSDIFGHAIFRKKQWNKSSHQTLCFSDADLRGKCGIFLTFFERKTIFPRSSAIVRVQF